MRKKLLPPIHPGEILREEFMKPLNLSANALAHRLGVATGGMQGGGTRLGRLVEQVGQVQPGNAYHARSTDWAENAGRVCSVKRQKKAVMGTAKGHASSQHIAN